MINETDKDRKDILLYNGLYTTSKVLLKSLFNELITDNEYIEEARKLFEMYEQLKEQK